MVKNIVKKNNGYCNKNRNRCCKNCFYTSSSKNCRTTGDLIGNEIADKITSLGKTKSKEKVDKKQELYLPPEKRQQIIDVLKLF